MRAIAIIILMLSNYQHQFCETTIFIFHKRFHQISRSFDWSNRWFVHRQTFKQHKFSLVFCCYDSYKHLEIRFYSWNFEISAVAKTIYCWTFRRSSATIVFAICRHNWHKLQLRQKKTDLDEKLKKTRNLLMISWNVQFLWLDMTWCDLIENRVLSVRQECWSFIQRSVIAISTSKYEECDIEWKNDHERWRSDEREWKVDEEWMKNEWSVNEENEERWQMKELIEKTR